MKDLIETSPTYTIDGDLVTVHVDGKFGIDGSTLKFQQQELMSDEDESDTNRKNTNYVTAVWCPLQVKVCIE